MKVKEVGCWPQRDSLQPSTLPPELDVPSASPSSRTHSKLESEDSSYDSGGEDRGEDETSGEHEDVSRTVSDTLAAELLDTPDLSDPYYAPKVEFALKLGYTQQQVSVALQKLGPVPGQNELLAELIKLGSTGGDPLPHTPSSPPPVDPSDLRHIVVDGSSVAMTHGKKELFSCRGILLCVEWFLARGHKNITVLVPGWRKEASRPESPIKDQEILQLLERAGFLTFTPSRQVGGKRIVSYDDRYVLKVAAQEDGVIVSNDNFRDLIHESPQFRRVIENNILMYSFVNDKFMPPDDPLGRTGPTLDNFLRKSCSGKPRDVAVACPYGKKCTYGNKCKFYHPERGNQPHKSVSEILQERVQLNKKLASASRDSSPGESLKSLSVPLSEVADSWGIQKQALKRTRSSIPAGVSCQGAAQLTPATPVLSPCSNSVSKSKSCENMTNLPLSVHNPNPNPDSIWGSAVWPDSSFVLSGGGGSGSENVESESTGASNLHRRLERQLTLHPTNDPRLFNVRAPASAAIVDKEQFLRPHSPLCRHKSAGLPIPPSDPWKENLHASVVRIASAPDYMPRQPGIQRMSSTSDTQLNMCATQEPPWQQTAQNTRYKLYYHLASIFPEEQVKAAMMMYPEETQAQKICAAILTMFPNNK